MKWTKPIKPQKSFVFLRPHLGGGVWPHKQKAKNKIKKQNSNKFSYLFQFLLYADTNLLFGKHNETESEGILIVGRFFTMFARKSVHTYV